MVPERSVGDTVVPRRSTGPSPTSTPRRRRAATDLYLIEQVVVVDLPVVHPVLLDPGHMTGAGCVLLGGQLVVLGVTHRPPEPLDRAAPPRGGDHPDPGRDQVRRRPLRALSPRTLQQFRARPHTER